MVVKVKDAETKRNKASVAHTGWKKRTKLVRQHQKRSACIHLQLLFQQKICKSASDRAAGKPHTPCDWASCVKERGLMRSSPTVLSLVLIMFLFSLSFLSSPAYCRYFCSWLSPVSLLRSLVSLFSSCKSSCWLHKYERAFFGVVVCATLDLFPRCFSVFHLDDHGSWEHQRKFCLCSIPLVDLSA